MKQIPLSKGFFAIVDDEDFEWLSKIKWHALPRKLTTYASLSWDIQNKRRGTVMHRYIMGIEYQKGVFVDHINGNGLDNRRQNLRICTLIQNLYNKRLSPRNKSGFKGVYNGESGKWHARIGVHSKSYPLGVYDTPEDAARAYNKAAVKFHAEFANLNQVNPLFPTNDRSGSSVSGFKGVKMVPNGDFSARLTHNGKHLFLGHFKTAEEAARVYDAKAKELRGEITRLNFP